MAKAPQHSPLTGQEVPPHYLHASSAFFRDTQGRAVLLRGINFSDTSKAPIGQPSHRIIDFWKKAEAGGDSFTGQPLNLDDGSADVHLRRLRLWGFNCLRWVFTWEALEHEGPGKYDYAYMDYLVAVLRKCKEYGFKVFMDPHQDLVSRFTGGSGAPYWVLPACGIDHRGLAPTNAAFIHCQWPSPNDPDPASFPDMIWATNYTRLAAQTISALFFAGHDLAPRCKIDGVSISEWLQSHFVGAVRQLALKIQAAGDLCDETVIGWDSLNEPNPTIIGLHDVQKLPEEWKLRQGPMPSPIQGMRLGVGRAETVDNYVFSSLGPKRAGSVTVDPKGASIWLSPEEDAVRGGSKWGWRRDPGWPLGQCVWAAHGVWDTANDNVLRPDYFTTFRGAGEKVDFLSQYWLPFWRKYATMIRSIHKEAIVFIQPPVFEAAPKEMTEDEDFKGRVAASPHFYDGLTLITKHWNWFNADAVGLLRGKYAGLPFALRFGERAIRKAMRDQLGYLKQDTVDVLGKYPTLIGELGIPFDLDHKKAYYGDARGKGKGDYSSQTKALDASLNACDGDNVLNYTLWTYCPDSTHLWSDGWNGEDLSIWSVDDIPGSDGADRSQDPDVVTDTRYQGAVLDGTAVLLQPSSTRTTSGWPASSSRPSTAISSKTNLLNEDGKFGQKGSTYHQDQITLTDLSGNDDAKSSAAQHLFSTALIKLFAGARSAEAFSRPYPIATTGTPFSINFDIKSSEFRYVMEVEEADVQDESVATEIFVPLVHYAADDVLAGALGRSDASEESLQLKTRKVAVSNSAQPSSRSSPSPSRNMSRNDTLATLGTDSLGVNKQSLSASQQSSSLSRTTTTQSVILTDERLPPLALDVSVSTGTWHVEGQVLKWRLPRDAGAGSSSSSAHGEKGKQRHEIVIKRKGGSIGARAQAGEESWCSSCNIL